MAHQVDAVVVNRKVALHLVDHVDHVAFGRDQVHRIRPTSFRADYYIAALFGDAADSTAGMACDRSSFLSAFNFAATDAARVLISADRAFNPRAMRTDVGLIMRSPSFGLSVSVS